MKPLPYQIRAELFLQLSRLEASGLPYDRGVATIALPAPATQRLKAMQAMAARGIDPATAGGRSGLFTPLEARLVRAALNAGSPASTYQRLALHYAQRARQWSAMKSRFLLPGLVLVIALLVQPLPALVRGSIGITGYLWQVVWPMLVIAAIAAVVRRLGLALYRPILVRSNLRDFFESLALMLEAGVPLLEALPAAIDTVSDGVLRRQLTRMRQRVERQETFAAALATVSYLHGSRALAFAHTGEQSGRLPEMLMRHAQMESEAIANFYEQVAVWLPRLAYLLVVIAVATGMISQSAPRHGLPSSVSSSSRIALAC